MRPPRYTGHLVQHGMLAICLLHKTQPEVLFRIPGTVLAACPKLGFQCKFIRLLRPDDVLGVVWQINWITLKLRAE